MGRACSQNARLWHCFYNFNRQPTGKITLTKPSRSREDNIRIRLKEIGVYIQSWIDTAQQGLLENCCECGTEYPGSINHRIR